MQLTMGVLAIALSVLRPLANVRQGWVLDGVIVALAACLLADGEWVATDWMSWTVWPIALIGGTFLFALSVLLTADGRLAYFKRTSNLRAHGPAAVFRIALLTPAYEEAVWRVGLQGLLCHALGPGFAIPIVAVSFSFWHRAALQGRWRASEFLLFSLVLGAVAWATHDPMASVAIHAVRNLLILSAYTDEASA